MSEPRIRPVSAAKRPLLRLLAAALATLFCLVPASPFATSSPEPPRPSLEAQIGQMLMVAFQGSHLPADHPILADIRQRNLGGVILFNYGGNAQKPAGNIESPTQLRALTTRLQKAAAIPLLIAIDQEGGRIVRLKQEFGFPATDSFQYLGQRNDPALTHDRSAIIARTLRRAGVNLNLSPVVDLDRNRHNPVIGGLERSFGEAPERVYRHARQVILAHHAEGVLCALKHFPGHGSSAGDSHHGFVDVTDTWSADELLPYRKLIGEGLADVVLTAHVFNGRLDPQHPATLSAPVIDGLLRGELGFDGVVLSDDLTMGAITRHYTHAEAVERAIHAGVDILLIADSSAETTVRTIDVIRELVARGAVSRERIEHSYRRILALKQKLRR